MARARSVRAGKQCIIEAQTAMSMEVHQNHVLRDREKSGRTVGSISEIPSPSPESQANWMFTDHHKKEPPNGTSKKLQKYRLVLF